MNLTRHFGGLAVCRQFVLLEGIGNCDLKPVGKQYARQDLFTGTPLPDRRGYISSWPIYGPSRVTESVALLVGEVPSKHGANVA